MTNSTDIERLIDMHTRRLQKLREQQASFGLGADPRIKIEIEDIEAQIASLEAALGKSKSLPPMSGVAQGAGPLPPADRSNEGVIFGGGTVSIGQMAVGRGSQASQVTYGTGPAAHADGRAQVLQAAAELLQALEDHAGKIADSEEIGSAVQQIIVETRKDKPNKLVLKSLVDGVKAAVGAQADVAPQLLALQSALESLFSSPVAPPH